MTIYEKLTIIQSQLKAPKDLENKFGGFNYRSAESILENLKPLLKVNNTALILNDEVVLVGSRYYIKSTATLVDCESDNKISASAYAREDEDFKGMTLGQLSGSTCSYARKYALCGLFAIDNGTDLDSFDTTNYKDTNKQLSEKDILMEQVNKLKINLDNAANYLGKSKNNLTVDDLQTIINLKTGVKK